MISGYELLTIQGDQITADLLVWRRYRCFAPGMVEALLDHNPHLARIHREGPFIPPGIQVRIPIDLTLLAGRPKPRLVTLWADNYNI